MGQGQVADLLSRRPGFDCRAVYITAVVDKVELGQVILRVRKSQEFLLQHRPSKHDVLMRKGSLIPITTNSMGHAVMQLFEALCYKPKGRYFFSRWSYLSFLLTKSFRLHCCPEVDSASDRNEYRQYFLSGNAGRCLGPTTVPPS